MQLKIGWGTLLVCFQLVLGKKFKFNHTELDCPSGGGGSGGKPAMIGEFPYMYSLGWKAGKLGYAYRCGATMIHKRYLLTAAHCLYDGEDSPVVVKWAERDVEDNFSIFPIEHIIEHPEYVYPEAYNDIAILRIGDNLQTDFVHLPTFDPMIGEKVIMIGYGNQKFAGPLSEILLKVDLKVYNNTECRKFYNPLYVDSLRPEGIVDTHLCAGDPKKIGDACKGDSGGPLLRKLLGIDYIIGITSFGIGCGNGPPGVYTRVSEYTSWIQQTMKSSFRSSF